VRIAAQNRLKLESLNGLQSFLALLYRTSALCRIVRYLDRATFTARRKGFVFKSVTGTCVNPAKTAVHRPDCANRRAPVGFQGGFRITRNEFADRARSSRSGGGRTAGRLRPIPDRREGNTRGAGDDSPAAQAGGG